MNSITLNAEIPKNKPSNPPPMANIFEKVYNSALLYVVTWCVLKKIFTL